MNEPIEGALYVPARGQRIVMPGNRPDWPEDGRPVDILDPYQRRLVLDGDLALKPDGGSSLPSSDPVTTRVKPAKTDIATTGEDSHDASQ